VPDNLLVINFDGVIGSYFAEIEYDSKGNLFPEHSNIWSKGKRFDNLFVRTGVAQGLRELAG
jgi:hypothetical protein